MQETQTLPEAVDKPEAGALLAPATCYDSGPAIIIDEARVNYFARKFYPHLTPTYGRLCILESLRAALSHNDALCHDAPKI